MLVQPAEITTNTAVKRDRASRLRQVSSARLYHRYALQTSQIVTWYLTCQHARSVWTGGCAPIPTWFLEVEFSTTMPADATSRCTYNDCTGRKLVHKFPVCCVVCGTGFGRAAMYTLGTFRWCSNSVGRECLDAQLQCTWPRVPTRCEQKYPNLCYYY